MTLKCSLTVTLNVVNENRIITGTTAWISVYYYYKRFMCTFDCPFREIGATLQTSCQFFIPNLVKLVDSLNQWSLTGGSLCPSTLTPVGTFDNVWRYFWLSWWGEGGGWCWLSRVEARGTAKHPSMQGTAPTAITQPKTSVVLWLRSPALKGVHV